MNWQQDDFGCIILQEEDFDVLIGSKKTLMYKLAARRLWCMNWLKKNLIRTDGVINIWSSNLCNTVEYYIIEPSSYW